LPTSETDPNRDPGDDDAPTRPPNVVLPNRVPPNEVAEVERPIEVDPPNEVDRPNVEPLAWLFAKFDIARDEEIADDLDPTEPRLNEFTPPLPNEWNPLEFVVPVLRAPPNDRDDPSAAPALRAEPAPDAPPKFRAEKDWVALLDRFPKECHWPSELA
jgi:hypothetical protein